jgi:CheY-like chemotaxis protein
MPGLKVLIIEDEKDFITIVSSRLKSWGHVVVEAMDGRSGIEACEKERPDVIVLDYMLPDKDGVDVLRDIRKFDKDVPVIMLTAYPTERTMANTEQLGINAFIPKLSEYSGSLESLRAAIDMIAQKKIKK